MANEDEELIFPMHLDLDVSKFEPDWLRIEPKLQAVLDKNPLKAKINIDDAALKNAVDQLSKLNGRGSTSGDGMSKVQVSEYNAITKRMNVEARSQQILQRSSLIEEDLSAKRFRTAMASSNAESADLRLSMVRGRANVANNKLAGSEIDLEAKRNRSQKSAIQLQSAELALERAKQRGTSATYSQNTAYQTQQGLLNGLPQFVNSYISILGAYRLGQNIVDTTAEFEMQRVSLAAIIQNKGAADKLFSQDVQLGLQSPFQIKDLISYTKQLAAYRIETDQLYDTTKRLADVSAGLGVDMSRLILAYGQVKAATYLRGTELRQFTEAGLPIIQLLADKFTVLNGKATTTADVFKLISQRGVSFGMVKSVMDDMTNAGGVFFNMQQIQSQTLKGSLSNLTDAYQKMFMEIGNQNMAPMKALVDGIKDLMTNWKEFSNVATTVGLGYGLARLSMLAYNSALGKENAQTIASLQSANAKEASLLRIQRRYLALTPEETSRVRIGKEISDVQISELMSADKLSKSAALRLVYLGKTNAAQELAMISTGKVTSVELELARGRKLTSIQANQYNQSLSKLISTQNGAKMSEEGLATAKMQELRTNTLLLSQSGKLTGERAAAAAEIGLVTDAEVKSAAATSAFSGRFGTVSRALSIAGSGLKSFGIGILGMIQSILPLLAVMATFEGIKWIVESLGSASKESKQQIADSAKAASEYSIELKEAYSNVKKVVERGLLTGADEKEITSARAALQQIVEKNEALKPLVEARLAGLTTEAQKLTEIKTIWDEIKSSVANGGKYVPAISNANASTKNTFGFGGEISTATKFSESIDDLDIQMGKIQTKYAVMTSDLQENLKAHKNAFDSGAEDINKYSQALEALRVVSLKRALAAKPGSQEKVQYGFITDAIERSTGSLSNLKSKSDEFVSYFKNSITTIGEGSKKQNLDWSNNNRNLTKENYNLLNTAIIESEQLFLKSAKEEEKAGTTMAMNIANALLGIKIPNIKPQSVISDFERNYNAYAENNGFTHTKKLKADSEGNSPTEETASDQLQKDIKANQADIIRVDGLLKNTKTKDAKYVQALKEEKKSLTEAKKENDSMWNNFFGAPEKPSKKTDSRISELDDQLKIVKDAYAKYIELQKTIGKEAAKQQITSTYSPDLKKISGIGKLSLAFTQADLNKSYSQTEAGLLKLGKDASKSARSVLLQQSDSNFEELKRNITENLDKLASTIEQTQKSNEFYEKMLDLTGSEEAASKLTKSFGMTIGNVRTGIQNAMSEEMKVSNSKGGVTDYGVGVNVSNIQEVQAVIEKMRLNGVEKQRESLQKLLNDLIDYDTKQLDEYYGFKNKMEEMYRDSPFLGTGAAFDISKLAVNLSAEIQNRNKLHDHILLKAKNRFETDKNYSKEQYDADVAYSNKVFAIKVGNDKAEAQEKLKDIAKTYVEEKLQSAGLGKDAMSDLSQKSLTQLNSNLEKLKVLQAEIKANKTLLPDDVKAQLTTAGLSLDDFIKEVEKLLKLDISDNLKQKTEDIKKHVKEILSSLSQLGSAISNLGKTTGNTNLAGLGEAVSEISNLVSTVGEDLATGDYIKAGLDTAMSIGTAIINDIAHTAELKAKLKEVQLEVEKQSIEDLINNKDSSNIFGTDYWDNVSSVVDAITKAKEDLDKTIAAAKSMSSNGSQSWYTGLLGGITGLVSSAATDTSASDYSSIEDFTFKSDNKSGFMNALGFKDKFKTIGDAAKELGVELYGTDGTLNPTSLQKIYDTYASEMDATQKEWFNDAITYATEYQAALTALDTSITELFGNVASSLSDSMMSAFETYGTTASGIKSVFEDLGNSITKSLVQSVILDDFLDNYKAKLKAIYADTSASSTAKALAVATLVDEMQLDLTTNAVPVVDALLTELKSAGLYDSDTTLTGISGAVASMTESEANTMGGYLNSGLVQWVQQTALQTNILATIKDISTPLADMYALQQQGLATINNIKSDTAQIVLSLGYILNNQKDSMIQGGTKAINVRLLN